MIAFWRVAKTTSDFLPLLYFLMFGRIRATLFWLLLFALPLHGMAGGMMPACASMAMPALSASGPVASVAIGHGSDSTWAWDGVQRSPCEGDDGMKSHSSDGAGMDCASSGGCGVLGADAPALLPLLDSTVRTIPVCSETDLHPRFLTGAPERPPRFSA